MSSFRRILSPVAFAVLLFAVIALGGANFRWHDGPFTHPFAGDFVHEYIGGYIILHGDRGRFYDREYAKQLEHDPAVAGFEWQSEQWYPMIYPPFYYLLVAPLYLLPIRAAALVWLALMIAAFTTAMVLLARRFPDRTILPWALPAGVFFVPMLESFSSDQKASVILLILTGTYLLVEHGRPFAAGAVFGLIAFKPQLALVIGPAMLLKRQWGFVAGSAVTVSVLVGLCFVVGPDVCRQYFEVSRGMGRYIETAGYQIDRMHCWLGFFRLLLPAPDWPLESVQFCTVAASAVTVGVLVWLLWGTPVLGKAGFAVQFSGLVIATLLLSPHLLTYDLGPLLLPMVLLTVHATEPASPLAEHGRLLLWLVGLLYLLGGFSIRLAALVPVQVSVLVMFGLLGVLAWIGSRSKCPSVP
jgi:hypothetical protein